MSPVALFDLDDTLLSTNTEQFLPGYFEFLGRALKHLATEEKITWQIHFAVEQMVANRDPGKTLKEVFAEHFYPPLGTTEAASKQRLEVFYRDEFPKLRPITQVRPAAVALIDWCRSEGITMAVATNPLFPATATRQRIEWAGLNLSDFAFFTSYDDFHFTKPHLTYYAEVLGRLGWPDRPGVMVGDNLTYDLLPMDKMGFETFWVNPVDKGIRWDGGTLADVKPWIKRSFQDNDQHPSDHPDVHLAILRSTPAVFDTFTKTFSLNSGWEDPSGHLQNALASLTNAVAIEKEVYHPMWEQMLSNPAVHLTNLRAADTPKPKSLPSQDIHTAMAQFIHTRKKTLAKIEALDEEIQFSQSDSQFCQAEPFFSQLLKDLADQDRHLLRQWVDLLDIHKIY